MAGHRLGTIAPLPSDVEVVAGTDVSSLWVPFRFYEAGHHLMDIMNPLSSEGLDQVVTALTVRDGDRVLDIACGHGEFLLRLATRHQVEACGIDLSPWTLRRAHQRLASVGQASGRGVGLVLGDGRHFIETKDREVWNILSVLGAPWIWGGFAPSVAALVPRLEPGGRLAIADVVAAAPEVRDRLPEEYGTPGTEQENRAVLREAGLVDLVEVETSAKDWRDYDDRVLDGLRHWIELFPEDRPFLDRQLAEEAIRADDADVGWRVWIGTKPVP